MPSKVGLKQHKRSVRRARRTFPRVRVSLIGLAVAGSLHLANPTRAKADPPPPAFAPGSINPFGLTAAGVFWSSPTFIDIDGDGDLDAFVGVGGSATPYAELLFFDNTGSAISPAFAGPTINPFGLAALAGLGPFSTFATPAFADIDGDGDLDAFVGTYFGSFICANTGSAMSPAFAAPVPAFPASISFEAPTFVDIDGDGDLDAFAGSVSGDTSFFENTGTATSPGFLSPLINPFGIVSVPGFSRPVFADLDGDGDLDCFNGGSTYGTTFFFENTGSAVSPAFAERESARMMGIRDVDMFARPSFADIDGDGDLDAFVGGLDMSSGTAALTFFENTQGPGPPPVLVDPPSLNPFGLTNLYYGFSIPTFVDIDGDGDLDAFIGETLGYTYLFLNTGTAVSPAFAPASANPFGLAGVGIFSTPAFADLDGDGDLDAFIGETNGNIIYFQNTGSATSPAFTSASANPFGLTNVGTYFSIATFADIDGDGDLDAFLGSFFGTALFFRNTGTVTSPAFAPVSVNPFGFTDIGNCNTTAFADLDGDGDLDALVGEAFGDFFYFENTGSVISPAFASASINPFAFGRGVPGLDGLTNIGFFSAPSFADIDGDGDFDLFSGESYGDTFFFLNNTPKPTFETAARHWHLYGE